MLSSPNIRRPVRCSLKLGELTQFVRRHAVRAFWVVMLLGHFPAARAAILNLGPDGAGIAWPRLLLLIASLAFFSLKAANVRWLRLPSDRRISFALVTIFILLHADVVRRSLSEDVRQAETVPVAVLTLATGIVAAIVVRLAAGHWETTAGAERNLRNLQSLRLQRSTFDTVTIRIPGFLRPAVGLRAPPV